MGYKIVKHKKEQNVRCAYFKSDISFIQAEISRKLKTIGKS